MKSSNGEIMLLPVANLKVAEYQRVLRDSTVASIVENFDPVGIGSLLVSQREGSYWVFDGQHRLAALKALGIRSVSCIVYTGMTASEEAKAWDYYNTQSKRATVLDKASAALFRGDPLAVAIDQIVKSIGMDIDYQQKGKSNAIKAYSALQQVYKEFGAEFLRDVLLVIKATLGTERYTFESYIIKGFAEFLHQYRDVPAFNNADFLKKVAECGIDGLKIKIKQNRHLTGRTNQVCTVMALRDLYNKKKTASKRLQ